MNLNLKTKLFFLILLTFTLLKAINIAPKISDENIYFYMAYVLAHGILPYRDFFFAHMPGQILILALPIKLFGFHLGLLKFIPILTSVGTATLLYLRTKNIAASTLFLFSLTVLATSDHGSGVHEATFFLTLAWFFLEKRKPAFAGSALFTGSMVRFYVLPVGLGLGLYYLIKNIRHTTNDKGRLLSPLVFLLVTAIPFLLTNFILWQSFGERFLTPVWRYHLLKSEGIDKGAILAFFLRNEWMLLTLVVVGITTLILQKFSIFNLKFENSFQINNFALFALIVQSLFLVIFADIYYLYLVTLTPFLAILGAQSIRLIKDKLSFFYPNFPYLPNLPYFVLIFYFLINSYNYQTNHAPVSVITSFDQIKKDVEALTRPQDTLFGSFAVAPLAAIETNKRLTNDVVDTNLKRYLAGNLSLEETTNLIISSSVFIQTAVVDSTGQILSYDPAFFKQEDVAKSCKIIKTYPLPKDYANNAILLWKCEKSN